MDVLHAALFIFFLLFLVSVVIGARRQGNTRATDEESRRPMPGDSLLPRPGYSRTRAVTIKAPPSAIWAWVERAGHGDFSIAKTAYVRNPAGGEACCGAPSAHEAALEGGPVLKPGDKVGFSQAMDVYVSEAQPGSLLVLYGGLDKETGRGMPFGGPLPEKYFAMSLALVIEEKQDGLSRLILRSRNGYGRNVSMNALSRFLEESASTMAEKAILLGIRKMAEEAAKAASK